MAIRYNLITDIPSVIAIECLINWVSLEDVCFVDLACCCRKEREVLLSLLSSPGFIVTQKTNIDDVVFIKWLRKRRVRVSSIQIETDGDRTEIFKYLKLYGMHVRKLEVKLVSMDKEMFLTKLYKHCRCLTIFSSNGGTPQLIENILQNSPDLEELRLSGVELNGKALLGIFPTLKLKRLELDTNFLMGEQFEVLRVSVTPTIERLGLSIPNFQGIFQTLWENCFCLRSLQVVDCMFMNDQHLQSIALNCPLLMHLNMSGNYNVSDVGILGIAMNLTQLRSLDISDNERITERSLQYLTQYRASHLEALYFDVWFMSNAIVSDLFLHSHKLMEVGLRLRLIRNLTNKEWKTVFRAASTIQTWGFLAEESLNEVPLRILAKNCKQLRELHIRIDFASRTTLRERGELYSLLACSPHLRVLKLSSDVYEEVVGYIQDMYPHLQRVDVYEYPYFDALAPPI